MVYPEDIRPILVEIDVNGTWTDITSYVLEGSSITINRGAGGEDNSMPPTTLTAQLNNADHRFTTDNPESPYWPHLKQNTPIRWTITHNAVDYIRYRGEIPDWANEVRGMATDTVVDITAGGLFMRWERGQPLISPLRRTIAAADTVVAYWAMEDDGANAQTLASALPGKPAMRIQTAIDVATYTGFVGSKPVPQIEAGQVTGTVAPYAASANQNILFLTRGAVASIDLLLVIINVSSGTIAQVGVLAHTNGDLRMRFYDNEGGIIATSSYAGTHNINDRDVLVRIILANDGADVDWRLGVIDQEVVGAETVTSGTVASRQIGRVWAVRFDGVGVPIGHAAVFNGDPQNLDVIAFDAFPAYVAERAADRYTRVCHENSVPMRIIGDSDRSAKMGPQPIGTLKAILEDCADTTHGIVVESRDELGVTMLLLDALDNQTADTTLEQEHPIVAGSVATHVIRIAPAEFPHFWVGVTFRIHNDSDGSLWEATLFTVTRVVGTLDNNSEIGIVYDPPAAGLPTTAQHARIVRAGLLALDYAAFEVSKPFKPVRDDRATANEIVLTRQGGSEYTARQDTGARSILDPPNGIGLYSVPETLNLYSDGQLAEHAWWMLNRGVLDKPRLPALEVGLHRQPLTTRQADLLAADIGHTVTVSNASSVKYFDPIQQIGRGYTETFTGNRLHTITVNGVPGDLHNVLVFDSGDRWAAQGSTLAEDITSTQTGAVSVAAGDTPWTTDAGDFPQDVIVGGERVTLSGITGAAGVPAFVGVGATAAANNASVTAGLPAGVVSGHVVYLLASIRNRAASVTTPTDWTDVTGGTSNVKVFARVYDGVWSMPAVAFTGGGAGDTTLALSAAFDDTLLVDAAENLEWFDNAGDQDISAATQNMAVFQGQRGLRLVVGHKFDDWSSVTVDPTLELATLSSVTSTLGNDAAMVWAYAIDTSSGDLPELTSVWTVTGGGEAVYASRVYFVPAVAQSFTITARSVNGVVKSHAAGATVDVAEVKHYGLGG